jgi:uncharacterized membrane protein ArfC
MDWPVLVLVAIVVALAAIGLVSWMRRRDLEELEADGVVRDPVAVPVEPDRPEPTEPTPVAVALAPTSAVAAATAPQGERGAHEVPAPAQAIPTTAPARRAAPAAKKPAEAGPTGPIQPTGDAEHPFGPGSATPNEDGSGPAGWTIKGNADSGLYHGPSSPSYTRMRAEAWFETEEAAEAAGFTRWDWRRTAS